MAINFPSSPANNQIYSENGLSYKFSSTANAWLTIVPPIANVATVQTGQVVYANNASANGSFGMYFNAAANTIYLNNVAVTQNISATYFKGNGSLLTGINVDFSPAFDKANSANVLAYNTGIGANAFTSATIAGANTAVGAGANAYANLIWSRSNAFTSATIAGANTAVGAGANAFTSATIAGANTAVGAGANAYSATVGTSANAFTSATIAGANTAVGAGANNYAATVGTSANAFTSATIAGANTAVGAGANAYANLVWSRSNAFTSATVAGANVITFAAFNQANVAYTVANAAFDKANSGGSVSSNTFFQRFVANGSQSAFLLSNNVSQQNNTIVSVDGLLQIPDLHYTVSGSILTFTTQPLNKSNIDVRILATTSTVIGTTGNTNNITVYLQDIYNNANIVGFSANTYASSVGVAANLYSSGVIGIAANSYASGVGANANTFASFVGLAANSYARSIGTASNTYAASIVSSASTTASLAFDKANSTLYTSNVVISVADNSNAALRITQTGTGAALVVEDSANPDTTPFVINANGSVGIGNTTPSSKLTVAGVIESTTGGVKFPDGTTQTTAPTVTTGKAIAMAIVFGG